MAREEEKLRLGKGAAFVKARLKRLRQEDETWEADFQALPKPITQSQTHYLGMVVAPDGSFLADSHVEGRPTVNDMATLLAQAMRRPLTGKAHRPRRLHVRGHPQWRELFPHLDELGIKVAVHRELPKVQRAYQGYLRQQRDAHRVGMVKPTAEQQSVEKLFPAIAQWVRGYGHIEIGDQEMFGFVARALDYGGLAFEDDRPDTLAEAMAAAGKGPCQVVQGTRDRSRLIAFVAETASRNGIMKPLPGDHRHRLLSTGDELRELKRHTGAMAEAFGLDRKINNYKGSRPITLYRWDLECLMDVIDLALKDEQDYPNRSSSGYLALKRLGDRLHHKYEVSVGARRCLRADDPLRPKP